MTNDRYKMFSPSGIVDEQATKVLQESIRQAIRENYRHIVINMKDITFMNSSAVGGLVLILKEVRNTRGEMYFCSLSDQVKVILELSRMHLVFRCFATLEEFETKILGSKSSNL